MNSHITLSLQGKWNAESGSANKTNGIAYRVHIPSQTSYGTYSCTGRLPRVYYLNAALPNLVAFPNNKCMYRKQLVTSWMLNALMIHEDNEAVSYTSFTHQRCVMPYIYRKQQPIPSPTCSVSTWWKTHWFSRYKETFFKNKMQTCKESAFLTIR